jgi:DNA repair exonuclease SbcCD ATPase subunit
MLSSRSKRQSNACPVCKTDLVDSVKFEQAEKGLDAEIGNRVRDATRRQTEEYRKMLREIRIRQQAEIRDLRKSNAEQLKESKDRLAAVSKKEKAAHKAALAKLKKNHQEQLRNLRDVYDRENLRLQKEQEAALNVQLQEIIRNYGSLATGHQKEQERLKKVHEEIDALLRKRDSEIAKLKIELAKYSSKLEVKDLSLKLHEKDNTILTLNSRIAELQGKSVPQHRPAVQTESQKTLTDDEQKEKLKEYMRAIIEITRSQQAEKKKTEGIHGLEDATPDLPESKVDKKLGWFF